MSSSFPVLSQIKRPCLIQRRGAEFSLTTIARHFGAELTGSLPYLWENMVGPLRTAVDDKQGIGTLGSYRGTRGFHQKPQASLGLLRPLQQGVQIQYAHSHYQPFQMVC